MDVCRCCLIEGTNKNLMDTYIWLGRKEIYSDMLQECYNISLSRLDADNCNGICDTCIKILRSSLQFKCQVLQCEQEFITNICDRSENIKNEFMTSEDEDYDANDADDNEYKEYGTAMQLLMLESTDVKKERKSRSKQYKEENSSTIKGDLPSGTSRLRHVDSAESIKSGSKIIKMRSQVSLVNKSKTEDEITDKEKHSENLVNILKYSNAIPFKTKTSLGYVCGYCDESYPDPIDLRSHTETNHKEERLDFNSRCKWKESVSKLDINNLTCNLCHQEIDDLTSLKEHLKDIHNKTIFKDVNNHILQFKLKQGDVYNCSMCPSSYQSFKMLLIHMNKHYNNYSCHLCDATFSKTSSLRRHKFTHQDVEFKIPVQPRKVRLVKKLQTDVITITDKEKHIENLTNILKYSNAIPFKNKTPIGYVCGYCDESYPDPMDLRSHTEKNHKGEKYTFKSHLNWKAFIHKLDINNLTCNLCCEEIDNLASLKDHLYHVHNITFFDDIKDHIIQFKLKQGDVYECSMCSSTFHAFQVLLMHMNKHYNNYCCNLCDATFSHAASLRGHKYVHQSGEISSSSIKTGRNILLKRKRMRKINLVEDPKTEDVTDKMKHYENLFNILNYSNAIPFKNKTIVGYICGYCDKTYPDPKDLRSHTEKNHKGEQFTFQSHFNWKEFVMRLDINNLTCNLCNEEMDNLKLLKDHLQDVHNKTIHNDIKDHIIQFKPKKGEVYDCSLCPSTYQTFKMLLQHMSKHYNNYTCQLCYASFTTIRGYNHHKFIHLNANFKCEHCDKTFNNNHKRVMHVKLKHSGSTVRNCPYCNEPCLTYYQRNLHLMKVHNLEAQYKCKVCDKAYLLKSLLTTHIKKCHLMERNYHCSHCELKFCSKYALEKHMVKHTGERNYSCYLCRKSYGRRSTLKQHMRIHSNDRRFKCDICKVTFIQKCSLRSHLLSNHGISKAASDIKKFDE